MKKLFCIIILTIFTACAPQPEAVATIPVARPTETAVPATPTPLPTNTPEPTETAVNPQGF